MSFLYSITIWDNTGWVRPAERPHDAARKEVKLYATSSCLLSSAHHYSRQKKTISTHTAILAPYISEPDGSASLVAVLALGLL